jgi:hypothetical protein
MAKDVIPEIAARYLVPEEKVREIYRQLQANGGTACQFDCSELGGPVQWMPGMVMTSRWDDLHLRARVDGLCSELCAIVRGMDTAAPAAFRRDPDAPPAVSRVDLPAGESWWPATLGSPAASGDQNGVRYAYFPDKHRLLLQEGARIDAYDTADHHLFGVAQQQGHSRSITFNTDHGPVPLSHFKCVPLA